MERDGCYDDQWHCSALRANGVQIRGVRFFLARRGQMIDVPFRLRQRSVAKRLLSHGRSFLGGPLAKWLLLSSSDFLLKKRTPRSVKMTIRLQSQKSPLCLRAANTSLRRWAEAASRKLTH